LICDILIPTLSHKKSIVLKKWGIKPGGKNMALKIGELAPDFTLKSHTGAFIKLSDYRGKNIVLAFFPLAWTPV